MEKFKEEIKEKRERYFEIMILIVGVCVVIFFLAFFTDTFKSFLPDHTVTLSKSDDSTDIYDALAVEINAINNILTWGSFIVAALTIAAAFFGILGVSSFRGETRNSIKSSKDEIKNIKIGLTKAFNDFAINQNTRLDNYNDILNDYKNKIDHLETDIQKIDLVRKSLIQQARYIDQTINVFFQATYSNISQMEDKEQANQLLANLFHDFQIAKLYRNNLETDEVSEIDVNLITALEYLENNGKIADIPHLEYIAQNDPNEENRNRARNIIGRIEEREKNKNLFKSKMKQVLNWERQKEFKKNKRHLAKMKKRKNRTIISRLSKLIKNMRPSTP